MQMFYNQKLESNKIANKRNYVNLSKDKQTPTILTADIEWDTVNYIVYKIYSFLMMMFSSLDRIIKWRQSVLSAFGSLFTFFWPHSHRIGRTWEIVQRKNLNKSRNFTRTKKFKKKIPWTTVGEKERPNVLKDQNPVQLDLKNEAKNLKSLQSIVLTKTKSKKV